MVSAVGCVCAGALQNHVAECKGRFSSHWHCWWCGCREGATSAKAPGPDMTDQLCSLCGAAHKGGASAPIRRALVGRPDCKEVQQLVRLLQWWHKTAQNHLKYL